MGLWKYTLESLLFVLIFLYHVPAVILTSSSQLDKSLSLWELEIKMPGVRPTKSDAYLCKSYELPDAESYIVKFDPIADQSNVHHMLVYSCAGPASSKPYWDCGSMMGTCNSYGKQQIIYAWAKNAPPLILPRDVGFKVSGNTGRKFIVLQLHYAHPLKENTQDYSGVKVWMSRERQLFLAGIYLLGAWGEKIPPHSKGVHVDVACRYSNDIEMNAFAFRTHTHALGRVVSGYRVRNNDWTLLGKGNPQAAQAFYPMGNITTIRTGDYVVSRCTYDSDLRSTSTSMGPTASDEMCNFYIMYFTSSSHTIEDGQQECWDPENKKLGKNFPPDSDTPVPLPHGTEETHSHDHYDDDMPVIQNTENEEEGMMYGHHNEGEDYNPSISPGDITSGEDPTDGKMPGHTSTEQPEQSRSTDTPSKDNASENKFTIPTDSPQMYVIENWLGDLEKDLGQVSGISLNSKGHVLIFHRADRIWNPLTFDGNNKLNDAKKLGPITEPTVWTIHPQTGQIISKWGKDMFYLPHGITVDHQDNLWLTDVGLHQVFKFSSKDSSKPEFSLGEKLTPGKDNNHFCKPTSVAVDSITGEFYVADGYCNGRIMKFEKNGKFLMMWGKQTDYKIELQVAPPSTFFIPHKLSLDETNGKLYVADRENNRIQCFDSLTGEFLEKIELPQFGGRVFSIHFNKKGNVLYAINGQPIQRDSHVKVQGFTINATSGELLGTWAPSEEGFNQPHDVISNCDNTEVYVVEIGPNHVWKFSTGIFVQDNTQLLPSLEPKRSELPDTRKKSSSSDLKSLEELTSQEQENDTVEPISPIPAIIITAVLLLPLVALFIAAVIRKVRSRRRLIITDMNNLPVLGQRRSTCPLNCCQTSYYSFDKVQVDSDSDIDV